MPTEDALEQLPVECLTAVVLFEDDVEQAYEERLSLVGNAAVDVVRDWRMPVQIREECVDAFCIEE